MARSRQWTNGYRKPQIALFFRVWRGVVDSAFAELNRVSGFTHLKVELDDVPAARAAGLYTEAWLRSPDTLAPETGPNADGPMLRNRDMLTVVLTVLAAPALAESLNPDAVGTLRTAQAPRWRALVDRARVLAFDDPVEVAAFDRLARAAGLDDWLATNRHNWLGAKHPGASSVAQHERMNAVVDAYFDDVYRVERLAGRRLGLLLRFPPFTLVTEPDQPTDQAGYDRRCELVDVQWHQRFAAELERRGFGEHRPPVEAAAAARESRALSAYRPDVAPGLSAYALVSVVAQDKDVAGALAWIERGGATGDCAALACLVLSSLAREDGDRAPRELQDTSFAAQAKALRVCLAALDAAPDRSTVLTPGDDTAGAR